jgi:phage tail tube protein FII
MAISLFEITHWNAKLEYDTSGTDNDISANLKGIITDLSSPILEQEFDTAKRAGELGIVPRPKFFNEIEVSFTIRGVFDDLLKALVTGTSRTVTLIATACIEEDDNTNKAYQFICKGFISSLPFGDLSEDGLEAEISMMCYYLEIKLGTSFAMVYDPRNYLLSIGGNNLFAGVKSVIDPPAV